MATTPQQQVIEREDQQPEIETEVLAPAQVVDSQTLALLQKGEIDQQIATAKKYPRNLTRLLAAAGTLVTADAETANECIYALPRGGKIIEGPSVRFAEIMAYSWGNVRCGARMIAEDEETVTSLGSFFDLEANVAIAYEVKRRITDKKGNRFNSDMVNVTANAASSIALRNAILRGIPKAVWRKVYGQARQAVAGDIKTLDSRRVAMLKAFELMGVKREQIFTKLGVKGLDDVSLDHFATLQGLYNAIREGEIAAEKAFAPELAASEDAALANKSKQNLDKIKEKYAQPGTEAKPISEADPEKAEKLRKEASRQKKAVAEKYGAKGPAGGADPAAQPAVTPAAAPSESQGNGPDEAQPPVQKEPEAAGADSGSETKSPEPAPEPVEDHGVALDFGEPKES